MDFIKYQQLFVNDLEDTTFLSDPANLYEPFNYIMHLGGKRLRPTALLMSTDVFGGDMNLAKSAAMAIEVFHNFTLAHDDIMDEAPLRRGQATVHMKYDVNTAILSGDLMLIDSYDRLFEYAKHPHFAEILNCFNEAARLVCHGQQLDVDFETRTAVQEQEYLTMIEWKTAVLFAAGLKMGALLANATLDLSNKIYDYGINVGLAFQVQDDILDSFGDPEKFGKKVGGDILQAKKTLLVIKTLEYLSGSDLASFEASFEAKDMAEDKKVSIIKDYFKNAGALAYAEDLKNNYRKRADHLIDSIIKQGFPKATIFNDLSTFLLGRES